MKYYVFEGTDGTGKSTIAQEVHHILCDLDTDDHYNIRYIREPEFPIRDIIMSEDTLDTTELLLFFADRYQQFKEVEEGDIVIADRSYISSLVYQIEYKEIIGHRLFDELVKLGELPRITKLFVVESEKRLGDKENRLDETDREEISRIYDNLKEDMFIYRYVDDVVGVKNNKGELGSTILNCAQLIMKDMEG